MIYNLERRVCCLRSESQRREKKKLSERAPACQDNGAVIEKGTDKVERLTTRGERDVETEQVGGEVQKRWRERETGEKDDHVCL